MSSTSAADRLPNPVEVDGVSQRGRAASSTPQAQRDAIEKSPDADRAPSEANTMATSPLVVLGNGADSSRHSDATATSPLTHESAHIESRNGSDSPRHSNVDEKNSTADVESPTPAVAPIRKRDFGFLPIPNRLRHDPDTPYVFSLATNVAFGFASTFTVATLYWAQSIQVDMAGTFGVTYQQVSLVPTMSQAGYATGILFLSPLGDLVRRRPFVLVIELCATLLSIGLAISHDYNVFMALSYLVGVCTITPQILLTYAADLAPPHRRAEAIAIVLSGLTMGVCAARVLAGIIGQVSDWQIVYQLGVAMQGAIWVLLWAVAPDTPAKKTGLSYFGILLSMVKYAFTEPQLIFSSLSALFGSVVFADLWVTLTFLLSEAPYRYSTLEIGLFGLIGILLICTAPFTGKLVDRLVPNVGSLIASCLFLIGQTVQVGAGGINVGAVIVCIIFSDLGQQLNQVSNSAKMYAIDPLARARMNAVFITCVFIGQVIGSGVGSRIFLEAGWRANAGFCLGFIGLNLILLTLRGPHEARYTWFGWRAGHDFVKRDRLKPADQGDAAIPMPSPAAIEKGVHDVQAPATR